MSRPWKTVYRSANRRVLVRPHPRRPKVVVRSRLLVRERIRVDCGLAVAAEVAGALVGCVLVLLLIVWLVDTCWPLFLVLVIGIAISAAEKK